jgi:ubiquitin carboxyl-terminal hydrolase L3
VFSVDLQCQLREEKQNENEQMTTTTKTWLPLESNPGVMTSYLGKLGLNTDKYAFVDVFSTEDWALDMVPRPVLAVLMLFPITAESESYSHHQQQQIKATGQVLSPNVRFIKQTIGNACGTIGLLHAATNGAVSAADLIKTTDCFLSSFANTLQTQTIDEVAQSLESDQVLETAHETAAEDGNTAVPTINEEVDMHFVCFAHVDGHLYELGGLLVILSLSLSLSLFLSFFLFLSLDVVNIF